jgi:hypothetical protein
MKLITAAIQKKLDKNHSAQNHEDIALKLFNPTGGQTWLVTQIEPDGDIMHGLADLGFGCVEYGTISLNEIKAFRGTFNLPIERDMHFRGGKVSDFINRTNLAGC